MGVGALRWILAPVWAVQVFTGTKSFKVNPIIGSLRLNRRGFHVWRARLAHRLADWRRKRMTHLISAEDRAGFERDGFVAKRDFLSPTLYRQLLAEVAAFAAEAREMKEGDAVTRRIALTPANLKKLPACRQLLALPEWRGLTRYISSFDVEPVVYIQTIFAHVDQASLDPQTSMHMDTFHPTMKAWLFLNDVEEDKGPFTYVPGSHRLTRRRQAWERRMSIRACDPATRSKGGAFRIRPEELKRLGFSDPVKFAVPGNTLVVGDTCGFHARGGSARPSARVEIWAYSRRNPFIPWTGLDVWALPPFRGRQAPLYWGTLEGLARLGLTKTPWRRAGVVTPGSTPKAWA
jgi:hypothetical protein